MKQYAAYIRKGNNIWVKMFNDKDSAEHEKNMMKFADDANIVGVSHRKVSKADLEKAFSKVTYLN